MWLFHQLNQRCQYFLSRRYPMGISSYNWASLWQFPTIRYVSFLCCQLRSSFFLGHLLRQEPALDRLFLSCIRSISDNAFVSSRALFNASISFRTFLNASVSMRRFIVIALLRFLLRFLPDWSELLSSSRSICRLSIHAASVFSLTGEWNW